MNENPKIRAQSFKELLLSFQSGAVFKSFISYNCIVMCSASFYYRLTNVSILHSGEFEFILFTIISSCTFVFCILTQPFKQCRPQTARPSPILFTTVLSAYIHVSLARGLSQPWNLEHTCLEHVVLCVSKNVCKNHCLCNIILLIWLCVTCHGNKILLRRQLTYESICRCNVLRPHVVATCYLVDCLRE